MTVRRRGADNFTDVFTRKRSFVKSDNASPNLFIEGDDIFSSGLLHKVDKCSDRETYLVTRYEHRIELISKEIYGDEKYSWLLLYMNRMSVEDVVRGAVIKYILKAQLDAIIDSL